MAIIEPSTGQVFLHKHPVTGANTALSNLASVQIDTDLIFADDSVPTEYSIGIDNQAVTNAAGNALYIYAGSGNNLGAGGNLTIIAGSGGGLQGGGNGGNLYLSPGNKGGLGGTIGKIYLQKPGTIIVTALLDLASLFADRTFTFPNATGTFALQEWAANQALSNLASVAINTSLISDTDSTDDLGSTTIAWANLYVDTIKSITGNALALTPVAGQSLTVNLATTGDLIVNTDDLVVDTSAGRVGIGTASPGELLHIFGNNPKVKFTNYAGVANSGIAVYNSSDTLIGEIGIDNTVGDIHLSPLSKTDALVVKANSGRVGIGVTSPTAILHLKAGTATANTAPLKFNTGALLTTAETGAVEFLTDAFYGTITTGAARKTFAFLESPIFTGTVTIPTPFTIGAVSLTATATELNILDGATLTTTELNYVDGVTSAIQTQLDAKASTDHGASNHTDRTRNLWIPAISFNLSYGSPSQGTVGGTYHKLLHWLFDSAVNEGVTSVFWTPEDFVTGNITIKAHWSMVSATSGVARLSLDGLRLVADSDMNSDATTFSVAQNLTVPGTAQTQAITSFTCSGIQAGDMVRVVFTRAGSNAADTATGDLQFYGVEIEYTADM